MTRQSARGVTRTGPPKPTAPADAETPDALDQTVDDDLAERAKLFAQVEVRPDQAKFRNAVFLACKGKCVVSGCDVPEALEAAHLEGRNWRNGQNEASDGVLLRRDLHALYDRGLLALLEGGGVQLDPRTINHYGQLVNPEFRLS